MAMSWYDHAQEQFSKMEVAGPDWRADPRNVLAANMLEVLVDIADTLRRIERGR